MPKDIVKSKLEADNAVDKVAIDKRNALIDKQFVDILDKTFWGTAAEKAIVASIKAGKVKEALTQISTLIDQQGDNNSKVDTAPEKAAFKDKLLTLAAYLEEINAIESAKQKEIQAIIDGTKDQVAAVLSMSEADFNIDVSNKYDDLKAAWSVWPRVLKQDSDDFNILLNNINDGAGAINGGANIVPNQPTAPNKVVDWGEQISEDYEDIESVKMSYIESSKKLFQNTTKRGVDKILNQENLSMGDNIVDGYSFRNFANTITWANVASAYSTLQADFPKDLSSSALRNYWKLKENKDGGSGTYSVDGEHLDRHEMKHLIDLTKFLAVVRDKNAQEQALSKEQILAYNIILAIKASNAPTKKQQLEDALGSYKITKALEKVDGEDNNGIEKQNDLTSMIAGILGDYNTNGKAEVKGDKNTITGAQIANAYVSQKKMLYTKLPGADYEKKAGDYMAAGLFSILVDYANKTQTKWKLDLWFFLDKKLITKGADGKYAMDVKKMQDFTEADFVRSIKEYPELRLVLKNMMVGYGEHFTTMFDHGRRFAEEIMERYLQEKKMEAVKVIEDHGDILTKRAKTIELSKENQQLLSKKFDNAKKKLVDDAANMKLPAEQLRELQQGIQALEENKEKNLQAIKVNLIAAGISDIEDNEGIGAGVNITSERINAWLSSETFKSSLNLSPGVAVWQDGTIAMGLMLTYAGAKTFNKDNAANGGEHRILFAASGGAGLSQWKLIIWPAIGLWFEEQVNGKKIVKSADVHSANYIGAMAHATLVSRGVDAFFRKDHREWIIEGEKELMKDVEGVINDVINTKSFTQDKIQAILKEKDPKTDRNILYRAAQNILLQVKPFEIYVNSTDPEIQKLVQATKWEVAKSIATNYALTWRNFQMGDLNKTWKWSGIGGGVEFIAGFMPIPRLGVAFSRYKGLQYVENNASVKTVNDMIDRGAGVDQDNLMAAVETKELVERLNKSLDGGKNFSYLEEKGKSYVVIEKRMLNSAKLYVSPDQADFIKYDEANWSLKVPAEMSCLLNTVYRDTKKEYQLLLGDKKAKDMVLITAEDLKKFVNGAPEKYDNTRFSKDMLEASIKNSPDHKDLLKYLTVLAVDNKAKKIQFKISDGVSALTIPAAMYDTKTKVITIDRDQQVNIAYDPKTKKMSFDFKTSKVFALTFNQKKADAKVDAPNSLTADIKEKLFKVSDVTRDLVETPQAANINNEKVMDMKYKKNKDGIYSGKQAPFVAFEKAMDKGDFINAKKHLAKMLGVDASTLEDQDVRSMNAKFAMGTDTRDKDVTHIEGWEAKLEAYAQELADVVFKGDAKLDIYKQAIPLIIRCKICADGQCDNPAEKVTKSLMKEIKDKLKKLANKSAEAQRLASMLVSLDDVANSRKAWLTNHLNDEIKSGGMKKGAKESLFTLREESLKATRDAEWNQRCVYTSKSEEAAIGMVFGYNYAIGAWVQEKFVWSPRLAVAEGVSTMVDIKATDHTALKSYFLDNLFKKDAGLKTYLMEKLVTAGKIKADDVKGAKEHLLKNGEFAYAFYAECFNETILLKSVKIGDTPDKPIVPVTPEAKVLKVAGEGWYANSYATTNKADLKRKDVVVGAAYGLKQPIDKTSSQPTSGNPDGGTWGTGWG
jgi:hypothetical protein